MGEIALTIVTGIIIAGASAWITVQLSLRKFRTEKWWERKVDAYSNIIEALHNTKIFNKHHLEVSYKGSEVSEEKDKELRQRSKATHDEIAKYMDTGGFLLSEETLSRLQRYRKEMEEATNTTDWVEYLENDLAATESFLKDIIALAKKDLQTK